MKEMSSQEYSSHIKDSFPEEYFTRNDGFVFSNSSLKEGLEIIQTYSISMEETLEYSIDTVEDRRNTLTHYLRKLQAVASILRIGLDGTRIQTSSK